MFEAVERFLRKHHWPPGNSQTVLKIYDGKKKKKRFCVHAEKERGNQFYCGLQKYWMLRSECVKCEKRE